ncbi:MAG: hypothetical protein WBV74_03780 [Pseudonocardiaceae bacterium]
MRLKQANPNDSGAIGRAFGAASNLVGVFGTLATDPQLRAAIHQTPECQHLAAANPTNQASQPPG